MERSSVSSPLTYLKEQGYEVDVLNITINGKVDIEHLKSLIRQYTILVSICYVDSEVGIVQPIHEIAEILKDYPNCFLHVDCTQGVGKIELDLSYVDLISFAPHKFYGLNGFGGLIKKKDIVLEHLINSGASTTLYRSGTLVFLVMDPGYNPINRQKIIYILSNVSDVMEECKHKKHLEGKTKKTNNK